MGGELEANRPPELSIEAAGTAPIASLEVIRSGEVVYSAQPGDHDIAVSFRDASAPASGSAHYHVRMVQSDGQIVWSSPVWVDYRLSD